MKKLCLALFAIGMMLSPARADVPASTGTVYVIPIRGAIEPAILYVIRRGVSEAESVKADAIVFVMDTPGGTLDAAGQIVRLLQKINVPTYTFVENHAFSAGAIIALATDHIYMAPGSVIGDAMPIMMPSTGGGPQEMPDSLQEKMVSGVAALIRSAAQESGHDPQLAEKMVRRETEYRIGDEVISPSNQLLTLTNIEAEREVGPEKKKLLSEGTVKDVDEMLAKVGMAGATQKELVVTWSEKIARFIAAIAPILFAAGMLGIYIEIKSPGLGFPGVIGAICLALFFWGHHIAGLAGMEEMLIFLIGLLLVIIEVFVFPTVGIIGLVGLMMMLFGLLMAMIQQMPGSFELPPMPDFEVPLIKMSAGIVMIAVFGAIFGRFLPKTVAANRLVLATSAGRDTGYTSAPATDKMVGMVGTATSQLRPSGTAVFGDVPVDVISRGGFVDSGAKVTIVEAHGSRIIVEEKKT